MNNSPLSSTRDADEVSLLLPLFKLIVRNRLFIVALVTVGCCSGLLYGILTYTKLYSASSSILLQSSQKVTSQDYTKVYLDSIVQSTCNIIVTSSTAIKNVILQEYDYYKNNEKVRTNLLEFYNVKDLSRLANKIAKTINLKYDKQTRVLTISYVSYNPDISAQIVNNLIDQINIFYNSQMTSDSERNLKFVKGQLNTAKEDLDLARLKLAMFIKRNKEINSVSLTDNRTEINTYSLAKLELQKLHEDAKAKEDLYNSLVKKSQDLGIQTEQKAPSVIVLQAALPSSTPLPRQAFQYSVMGGLLMLFLAIGAITLKNLSELTNRENIVKLISEELMSDFDKVKRLFSKKNSV